MARSDRPRLEEQRNTHRRKPAKIRRGATGVDLWRLHFCSGRIESGKYLEGAQRWAVKLWQPKILNSRMMRV